MKNIIYIAFILFSYTISAQEIINTMFYNLLEFPEASPGGRPEILKNILAEFQPDIFMVCELQSEEGADDILDITLNSESTTYSRANFVDNQSGSADLQQLIFYKTNKFSLESSEIITTTVRDINKYVLKLNTVDQDVDPIIINIFVTHLKSSQGTANKELRLQMVTELTSHLETLDPNSFVIFAGDFNLYTSTEPAYQELLDPTNAIIMLDPIDTPGSWHNNDTYQNIHSQSTRIDSGPFGAGAGGGLDDRFDFITFSENMMTDAKLKYVTDSYKPFGNNGNCYNMDISDETCVGEFSQSLRNNLFSMSDHLPIIMQLETNKEFVVLSNTDFTYKKLIYLDNTLVDSWLNIDISEEYSNQVLFSIYNTLGQEVLHFTSENHKTNLDVSFLQSGLFYIKTNIPNQSVLKFLKR
ncbi:MAG: T9SS type A sorting domain-containing protein [Flavobacteriaceae bacterium]